MKERRSLRADFVGLARESLDEDCLAPTEELLGHAVFEAVLGADGCDAQYQLDGVLEYSPCWRMDEGHVRVEAFEEGGYVAREGMAGGELECRVEDIAEGLNRGVEAASLIFRDTERLSVGINQTRVLLGGQSDIYEKRVVRGSGLL